MNCLYYTSTKPTQHSMNDKGISTKVARCQMLGLSHVVCLGFKIKLVMHKLIANDWLMKGLLVSVRRCGMSDLLIGDLRITHQ